MNQVIFMFYQFFFSRGNSLTSFLPKINLCKISRYRAEKGGAAPPTMLCKLPETCPFNSSLSWCFFQELEDPGKSLKNSRTNHPKYYQNEKLEACSVGKCDRHLNLAKFISSLDYFHSQGNQPFWSKILHFLVELVYSLGN